jgi:hypothetical protein
MARKLLIRRGEALSTGWAAEGSAAVLGCRSKQKATGNNLKKKPAVGVTAGWDRF